MPFGFTHKPLVALANSAICSFFKDIEVFGSENIPAEGPIIFACTHVNMAVDPALLSNTLPHGHLLHYWVKDSLFKNPAVGAILNNAGNIAVDRKNKNNQKLFKGTFEALARNECIGVFPEGTSHTEPHIIALKDGTSWAALEYLRYLQGTEENKGAKDGKPAIIIPVGIAYVNKSKYRSRVAVNYGAPIDMSAYKDDFLSEEEGKAKLAVKRLTRKIELEVKQMTVNSPDWDTAFAAQMAREILWEKDESLKLSNYVEVGQTLSDLFTTNNPRIRSLRELLVSYHRLLQSSRLSNAALIDVPLPKTLDPSRKVALPSRITTLWVLFKDTISCLLRLPFFFIPLVFNLPIYGMGLLGGKLVEDELETQAQMKIALALLLSLLMYPIVFFSLWAVFRQSPIAAAVTAGSLWVIRKYHLTLVDENYEAIKRLIAAWRILIGVWLPRRLEMPLPAFLASSTQFAPDPPKIAGLQPSQEKEKWVKPKKVPSRFLVRNVLRVRIEAAKELAAVLLEVEDKDEQVNSSFWLAQRYGGEVLKASKEDEELVDWERPLPKGVRSGREVIQFLREKGARLGRNANVQDHWAAASSGDEAFKTDDERVRG